MALDSWVFMHICRRHVDDNDNYGFLWVPTADKAWEFYSYTYELPWVPLPDQRSTNNVSRIEEGLYPVMFTGTTNKYNYYFQLDTTNTAAAHRFSILVHRASPKLIIEGCILPVHFIDEVVVNVDRQQQTSWPSYVGGDLEKAVIGDAGIQTRSEALMLGLRDRFDALKAIWAGTPYIRLGRDPPGAVFLP